MLKKGYFTKSVLLLLLFSLLTEQGTVAQNIDLLLEDQLNCSNNTYCVSIQIQSDAEELSIGTSSIFLKYNASALSYFNYTSSHFDGSDQCIQNAASSWDVQAYDATSVPGSFNLTLTLVTEQFSCPKIGKEAVEVGILCFNVLDSKKLPNIEVIKNNTSFNGSEPNNGENLIAIGKVKTSNDVKSIQCEESVIVDCTKELWEASEMELNIGDCDELANFCTGISFNNQGVYELLVNNVPVNDYTQCETGQTVYFYTYSSLLGLEKGGNFEVVNWTVNETNYKSTFHSIEDLVDLLKTWDSKGQWTVNSKSNAIQGGTLDQSYGLIEIRNADTGLSITMGLNKKVSDFAAGIYLAEGIHTIVATNRYTSCQDKIEVRVKCAKEKKRELAGQMEEEDTKFISITKDTILCLRQLALEGSYIEDCSEKMGEYSALEIDYQIQCVSILTSGVGKDQYCLSICDEKGNCKILQMAIDVVESLNPILRDDIVSVMMNEPTVIEVKANDIIKGSIRNFDMPYQRMEGTVDIDREAQFFTYTSSYNVCGIQDSFQYVIADELGEGMATVKVDVLCEKLTVFSGFSPNGDGVNDYFKIMGIENFKNNELTIFNSRGNEVYSKVDYKNEDGWDGTWKEQMLANGTYFYVLNINNGESPISGYVQVQR